ncbi:MAG: hypothetical protein Roseis2KO_15170 [Roseivirga sp.]
MTTDTISQSSEQESIKAWFDHTYQKWGFTYLRSVKAYYLFHSILAPAKKGKHLDIACGLGHILRVMTDQGHEAHGIDISDVAIEGAKKYCPEATVSVQNAQKIDYPDETFDTITCIGSLERMLDRPKALAEIRRLLNDSGKCCIMVRNAEHLTWQIRKSIGFVNRKGHQGANNLDTWSSLFEENGFKVLKVYPDHWPYYKFRNLLFPFKKADTSVIKKFPFSIRYAYEHIFLLEKDD